MILPIDLEKIDIDVLGKFFMGVFFKWTGAWYEPRNNMEGYLYSDGWATYVLPSYEYIMHARYKVPTKEEVAGSFYPHSGEDKFNSKYLSSFAVYEFEFIDGSVLERNKAGGFRWLCDGLATKY